MSVTDLDTTRSDEFLVRSSQEFRSAHNSRPAATQRAAFRYSRSGNVRMTEPGTRPVSAEGAELSKDTSRRATEWRTVGLLAAFMSAWLAIVLGHQSIPWPVQLVALVYLGGLWMSLGHELPAVQSLGPLCGDRSTEPRTIGSERISNYQVFEVLR